MDKLFYVPSATSNVFRFAGKHVVGKRSSIAEHSFEVVYYTSLIVKQANLSPTLGMECLEYAMVHDIPEVFTGDVPYTAKAQFPELKVALDKVENAMVSSLIPEYKMLIDNMMDEVKFICKLADAIAVTREISTEISLNNPAFGIREVQNCVDIFNNTFSKYKDLWCYRDIVNAFYAVIKGSQMQEILADVRN